MTQWASSGFRWSRGKMEGKLELELNESPEQEETCPSKYKEARIGAKINPC